jgi:hypothetical protein
MKKLILALLIGLIVSTAAFADHEGLGLGVVLGGGGGDPHNTFTPGFSLKLPASPIFWGIYANVYRDSFITSYGGFSVTGDLYIFDRNLISTTAENEEGMYKVKIDWYLGLGGVFNMNFWKRGYYRDDDDSGVGVGLGLRVPVGLSWHVVRPFEIALGLVPVVGLYAANKEAWFWWNIGVELAFRFWLLE